MVTPLYKNLKENGTSFYAFPGAAEDISAAYQNSNYKMYFSKYVLLDLPIQNLVEENNSGGTASENLYWNFTQFESLSVAQPASYAEQIIESLRNYVANHEITIRESRLNNTEYYYDNTALETTAEKIFFKWCKKLGIFSLEPALPEDEYFNNLNEFQRKNVSDETYFSEYLWKEREVSQYQIIEIDSTAATVEGSFVSLGNQALKLRFGSITNFRDGDVIEVDSINDIPLIEDVFGVGTTTWLGPVQFKILSVTVNTNDAHDVVVDFPTLISVVSGLEGVASLVYHRLVKYIGEVNGVSNVQEANKAYTEVYAHVPDHTGRTPDILFRTMSDTNYKPGMIFPIIPNQYQPEIIGAEIFSSPIVSNPQNYPGSYYGQFDTEDFTYEIANGDSLRRSGDFYGVDGDINTPVVNGTLVDGIIIDFDTTHYVKMNLKDRAISNFDQFNALEVNNQPPQDFEFNAILWYYTVEDNQGNKKTNLYGISFLDHPDNNPKESEISLRFPPYKKLVTNGSQDGTSYAFSLNLNFNIINENPVDPYNPESINSIFSMNLFNEAMKRLASANDSFLNIISEHSEMKDEMTDLKQLLYTQKDFDTINAKITNLEELLRLYSTMQTESSDTIEVEVFAETTPPSVKYNSIDRRYKTIEIYNTSGMYNTSGILPVNITVPRYKDFMVHIVNNDEVFLTLPNNDNLKLVLTSDLEFRQSVDILVTGTDLASENKKLDIYVSTINPLGIATASATDETEIETLIISDIDLPIFYNKTTSQPNSAKTWKDFNFNINLDENITLTSTNLLEFKIDSNANVIYNSIKQGDTYTVNNLFIGTSSIFDFSGQYIVNSVGLTNSIVRLDITNNEDFVAYGTGQLPLTIHSTASSILSNNPYLDINKGQIVRITRISQEDQIPVSEKYLIDIRDIQY
jgi:hypothetical protein